MTCPHYTPDRCAIAESLAPGYSIRCTPAACAVCDKQPEPRAVNQVTLSLAASGFLAAGLRERANALLQPHRHLFERAPTPTTGPSPLDQLLASTGPGRELHRIFSWFGWHPTALCKCIRRALQMNQWGPAKCRENLPEIVGWVLEEARDPKRSRLTRCAPPLLARLVILWAIARSERAERARTSPPTTTSSPPPPPNHHHAPRKLILRCDLRPGDLLTLTAAIETLHRTYPGEYQTDVRTRSPAIWTANPHLTPIPDGDAAATVIDMHYDAIHRSNQESIPFLSGYTEHLAAAIARPLRLCTNRPHLYLTPEEAAAPPAVPGPFWLLCCGIDNDWTTKAWPLEYWQDLVDITARKIRWVQIGLPQHNPVRLSGALDLCDTGPPTRDLILLTRHARGAIGPITFLQHLAAAWHVPYVALLGGREPTTWTQYPYQHTLHTVGLLPCCRTPCWKMRTVARGDHARVGRNQTLMDDLLCARPRTDFTRPAPDCMARITPDEVAALVLRIDATRSTAPT